MTKTRWHLLLLVPCFLSFLTLGLTQFLFIRTSFYADRGFGLIGDTLELTNYFAILRDPFYLDSLRTTFVLSVVATAVTLIIGYPAAYILARLRSRWTAALLAAIMLASFISVPIKILGIVVIFSRDGRLNQLLKWLNIASEPITVLGNSLGVVLGFAHYTLGFVILLLYSVIQTIPRSYEEAAQVHGAGRARILWRVVLPLSLPGLAAAALTTFNLNMGAFTVAVLLGGGRVLTLPVLIQRSIFLESKYAQAGALAAVLLVFVIVANLLFQGGVLRRSSAGRWGRRARSERGAASGVVPGVSSPERIHLRFEASARGLYRLAQRFPMNVVGPRLRMIGAASWLGAVYVFLLAPLVVVAGASLNGGARRLAYVEFPPRQLSLDWYFSIPASQFRALALSIVLASVACFVAIALAVPAALGLVRSDIPGKRMIAAAFRAPLQIPAVVIGLAFFQSYYLVSDIIGFNLVGSFIGLLIAHVFFIMPYVFGSTVAIVERFDLRLEGAALSLGASPWRSFRRVMLPVILPGIYSGAIYAFMASFTDVPVTVFLTGPHIVTYPVEIFDTMRNDFDGTLLASCTLVIGISVVIMLIGQRTARLGTLIRAGPASK